MNAAVSADATRCPGQEWEVVAVPEEIGWSGARLSRAWDYAESIGSLSVMVVTKGKALARWGEDAGRSGD